jgi:O-methyltransferase involved in polyketide biosynthesis
MPEKTTQSLEGVSETLLIPLYTRALEAQRPDAMLKDEKAVAIVQQIDYDFDHIRLHGHDELALILRVMQFDLHARQFLARNPDGVVVHIGCGLDTRFERVDNGTVEWYDLDLPEVIELRKKLIGGETARCRLISGSIFGDEWLEAVSAHSQRPFLFLAEGVLPYFKEAEVKGLVLKLRERFAGAELVCDAHTPFVLWADNRQLASSRISARLQWGLKHGRDVESWGEGIVMLDEWFYFTGNEPRVKPYRWMRLFPLLGRSTGIFHYRLGTRVGGQFRVITSPPGIASGGS